MTSQIPSYFSHPRGIELALRVCTDAHNSINQVRKYSGEPYWTHPVAVLEILKEAGERDEDALISALLHDVLEDVYPKNPKFSPSLIYHLFGGNVIGYVRDLTEHFTSELYPDLNRGVRKKLEAEKLVSIPDESFRVKLADLIHNTASIVKHDEGFAEVYLDEKAHVLQRNLSRIQRNDLVLNRLYTRASEQIEQHRLKILERKLQKKPPTQTTTP